MANTQLETPDLVDVVSRYLEALARFDLKEAASCFTDYAFYSHPPYSSDDNGGLRHEVRGHSKLIALWEKRGPRPTTHEIHSGAIEGRSGFVRGTFSSTDRSGSFVSAVTLAEDGRIESYVAYSSIPPAGE
jgi:SnoaL-like domain